MGEMSNEEMAHIFKQIDLSRGWQFRQTDQEKDEWLPVRQVPSTVHQDLIDNGLYVLLSRKLDFEDILK